MQIPFTKMQGIGNDYIYVNCMERTLDNPQRAAVLLSDRHFGVGGDGLVLIAPSDIADARMIMFNQDGSEGRMCGNAIRCVAKFLYEKGIVQKPEMTIETLSGVKTLHLTVVDNRVSRVTVDMGKAVMDPRQIPVNLSLDKIVDHPVVIGDREWRITCVSMGNPHCVVFCEDAASLPLRDIGPAFEHFSLFPERMNTEFIKVLDDHTLEMRVWERGSGETLACGTGACAAVVAATHNGHCVMGKDVTVCLRGGELSICYTEQRVLMTGGCEFVFEGFVNL